MDDQQAREAAAKALAAQFGYPVIGTTWQDKANAAIDAYLAALPATPEQPRQANEEQIVEALANRLGEHPAAFNVFDITDEATTGIKLNEPVEELAAWLAPSVAALVSSPSEQSAAP